ncbi:MAG: FG-GAP repeat protein, partial [Chloroflexia bacterium]|nr:FG-GAP repeat protein [Chloroflexia bacterium]
MGMGMNMHASIEGVDRRGRVRGRLAVGLEVLAAVVFGALVAGASSASAATPATPYKPTRVEAPQPDEGWGERSAAAGDIDGDGVSEIFVGVPAEDVGSKGAAGRVYLLSGKNRSVISRFESPEVQEGALFGFFISVLGDVDGDGKDDIAVGADQHDVYTGSGPPCGAAEPNGCNERQGKAWVFSGDSPGAPLYQLANPEPPANPDGSEKARFGSRIGRAGDLTGDGRSEVIVGASHNDVGPAGGGCGAANPVPPGCRRDEGQAFIFDGSAAGPEGRDRLLRTLNMPDPADPATTDPAGSCTSECGTFGLAVQGPGDVDGDGVADQLVDAGSWNRSRGRMYLFSGDEGGKLLARIDSPEPQNGATFGFQDAAPLSPGDVTGDGRADLYGNSFGHYGSTGPSEGRAWVFDGAATVAAGRGVMKYELTDPTPEMGGQFGFSLNKTLYNRDGTPDLYVGQSPHHVADPDRNNQNGGTYVFDGKNGAELKRLELPESDVQPGDGPPSGGNGPALGWSAAAPGDLNGDGEPDYVAGAPYLDVGSKKNQGRLYVFLSGCAAGTSAGVTCTSRPDGGQQITGTPGDDTIVGTDENDVIDAGGGNDVVVAQGGNDAVNAGAGNDYVSGGEGNDRISGSTGNDYLVGA